MNKVVSGRLSSEVYKDQEVFECEVLMSTYNGEKYVGCQIDSILAQKNVKVKLLIRDDGSKDNTLKILKLYQDKYPDRVKVIAGDNVGIHQSFANLIEKAEGLKFIAFSDQDDRWDENKLLTGILELNRNKASFYSSAARLVDNELNEIGMTTADPSKYKYYMCTNSKVLTPGSQGCTIILDQNLFELIRQRGYPATYGHDTWITIVAYLLSNCLYDDQPHMDYRQHNESWTGNRSKHVKQFFLRCRFFIKGLSRYEYIARDVLNRYEDVLDENTARMLACIAKKDENLARRMKDLRTYHFGKYGAAENFVYKIYYLFF